MVAHPQFDADGNLNGVPKDEFVTPGGHMVNDVDPFYRPHNPKIPANRRMPPQTLPTIGERMSDAGVSWAWYANGWDQALAGKAFEGQHPVPVYFKHYADGTREKTQHMKDESDFLASLDNDTCTPTRDGAGQRKARRQPDLAGKALVLMGEDGDHRNLRRLRRLVRSPSSTEDRSLGTG
jgi:hypothetical protein